MQMFFTLSYLSVFVKQASVLPHPSAVSSAIFSELKEKKYWHLSV